MARKSASKRTKFNKKNDLELLAISMIVHIVSYGLCRDNGESDEQKTGVSCRYGPSLELGILGFNRNRLTSATERTPGLSRSNISHTAIVCSFGFTMGDENGGPVAKPNRVIRHTGEF